MPNNIFYKSVIGSIAVGLCLSGCANTEKGNGGNVFSGVTDMFETSTSKTTAPAWANEPLITAGECNSFTMDNVSSFVSTYDSQPMGPKDSAELAGQKAMDKYTLAAVLVNRAQLCMAQALDLKGTIETLEKEREILLSGTSLSKEEIEKHREYSAQASAEVKKFTSEIDTIEPEKRESLTLGIATFLTGSYTTVRVTDAVQTYIQRTSDDVSSSAKVAQRQNTAQSWLAAGQSIFSKASGGGTVIYNIASGMTDHVMSLYDTGNYFMEFAKSQDLNLPADATSGFLSESDWGTEETL